MDNSQSSETGKVLYISEYGEDSNETVLHAIALPVIIRVYLDKDGTVLLEFCEKTDGDGVRFVCQTNVVPSVAPPVRLRDLNYEISLEENIAKTVTGWIAIYMRDGVFCTDSKKETFVRAFDLRDVAERLQNNLDDIYNKYRDEYK